LGAKISGSLIATGGNDNHVYIFDIRKPSDYAGEYMHGAAVKSLAWVHDEQILVSGGGTADKKMKFWDNSKGKIIK
jgi:cell division cycle 20-like protein 1 (cofactor of APC complex)